MLFGVLSVCMFRRVAAAAATASHCCCWNCPQEVKLDSKNLSRVSSNKKAWKLVRDIAVGGDGARGLGADEDDFVILMQAMTIFLR